MRKSVVVALFLALLFTTLPVFTASPAQAGVLCDKGISCGKFYHYSPDKGYDRAILIRCHYGKDSSNQLVKEGKWDTCEDVDQVRVRKGEELWCFTGGQWKIIFDATKWHKITDLETWMCVNNKD